MKITLNPTQPPIKKCESFHTFFIFSILTASLNVLHLIFHILWGNNISYWRPYVGRVTILNLDSEKSITWDELIFVLFFVSFLYGNLSVLHSLPAVYSYLSVWITVQFPSRSHLKSIFEIGSRISISSSNIESRLFSCGLKVLKRL